MTCAESQDLLLDLAYGELAPSAAAELEAHVAGCAACQRERAGIAGVRAAMAPLRAVEEPPARIDEPILQAARAEAGMQHDGLTGEVIEVHATAQAPALEAARLDPRAKVKVARPAVPQRRWSRLAIGGSLAAAAALVLLVSTSQRPGHEGAPLTEDNFRIKVRAPQEQAPAQKAVAEAVEKAAAPVQAPFAPAPATQPPPAPPAQEAGPPAASEPPAKTQREAEKRAVAKADAFELGGGGDVSAEADRAVARSRANRMESAQAAANDAGGLHGPSGAAGLGALSTGETHERKKIAAAPAARQQEEAALQTPALEAAPPAAATALPKAVAVSAAPARPPAAADTRVAQAEVGADTAAPALEQQARRERLSSNYAAAAQLYRKAAALHRAALVNDRGADPSIAAWDLAHAIECLTASGNAAEARLVRDELARAFPSEESALAAAGRALRPFEQPASAVTH